LTVLVSVIFDQTYTKQKQNKKKYSNTNMLHIEFLAKYGIEKIVKYKQKKSGSQAYDLNFKIFFFNPHK